MTGTQSKLDCCKTNFDSFAQEPTLLNLTATKTGVNGTTYYACVRAVDKAGNLSAWISSATPVTVETSAAVISSVTSDGYQRRL